MAQFYAAVMTNDGAALLAEAIAGNANIQFTTMVAGDGEYSEAEHSVTALQAMTSLKSQKQSVGFSSLMVESKTCVHLTGILDNEELAEGYYVRELGIYAKNAFDDEAEPVLYSITVAQAADYMPPYNGLMPTTIIQEYFATVANSANVTLVVGTGIYALAEDFENHKKNIIAHITDSERAKWNGILEESRKYSDATYQQSTGYTDQKIADLINGAPSTLDTLGEIAKAMGENKDVVDALYESIGKKANQAEMESLLNTKLDKTGDAKDNTVTFTSEDTTTPSGWANFDPFKSGETFKTLFGKISTIGRNLRWLYKMLGTTGISDIGNGTVTGALDELNRKIDKLYDRLGGLSFQMLNQGEFDANPPEDKHIVTFIDPTEEE